MSDIERLADAARNARRSEAAHQRSMARLTVLVRGMASDEGVAFDELDFLAEQTRVNLADFVYSCIQAGVPMTQRKRVVSEQTGRFRQRTAHREEVTHRGWELHVGSNTRPGAQGESDTFSVVALAMPTYRLHCVGIDNPLANTLGNQFREDYLNQNIGKFLVDRNVPPLSMPAPLPLWRPHDGSQH